MVVDYNSYIIATYIQRMKINREKKEQRRIKEKKIIIGNEKIVTNLLLLSDIFIEGKGLRIVLEEYNKVIQ